MLSDSLIRLSVWCLSSISFVKPRFWKRSHISPPLDLPSSFSNHQTRDIHTKLISCFLFLSFDCLLTQFQLLTFKMSSKPWGLPHRIDNLWGYDCQTSHTVVWTLVVETNILPKGNNIGIYVGPSIFMKS